jgi:anti-anti-sigma regulatory factor
MTKTTTPISLKIEEGRVAQGLLDTCEKLDSTDDKIILDFSSVSRVSPNGLAAIEIFADKAEQKAVNVVLSGVNVEVYKVLKLARLTSRFAFVD